MDFWESLLWKARLPLRCALWIGLTIWVVVIFRLLAQPNRDVEGIMALLFVGGGCLFFTWRIIQAVEASMPFKRRRAARDALRRDPTLSESEVRSDVIPFLVGPDYGRVALCTWGQRLEPLLSDLIVEILSSSPPTFAWNRSMRWCLDFIEKSRAFWAVGAGSGEDRHPIEGSGSGLSDLERLEMTLVCVVLLSALFRLHLLIWGTPPTPFSREAMGRLRRNWIPFCLLTPTSRPFPPSLPAEMEEACRRAPFEASGRLYQTLALWIFRGERRALLAFVQSVVIHGP